MKGLKSLLYKISLKSLSPIAKLYFKRRGKKDPEYLKFLDERFKGEYQDLNQQFLENCETYGSIHLHGASLGEIKQAITFAKAIIQRGIESRSKDSYLLQSQIIITTNTPAGRAEALKFAYLCPQRVAVAYLPLEQEKAILNFVDTFKVSESYLVETEIWPLLISCFKQKGIKVNLISARISQKYYNKYSRYWLKTSIQSLEKIICQNRTSAFLFASILQGRDWAAAQELLENSNQANKSEVNPAWLTEYDNFRKDKLLHEIHYPEIIIGGSLKFVRGSSTNAAVVSKLVQTFINKEQPDQRLNLLIASTYLEELAILMPGLNQRCLFPIIAPRHRENFALIQQYLEQNGWKVLKFSACKEQFKLLLKELNWRLTSLFKTENAKKSFDTVMKANLFPEILPPDLVEEIKDLQHLYSDIFSLLQGKNSKLAAVYSKLINNSQLTLPTENLLAVEDAKVCLLVDTFGDLDNLYNFCEATVVGGTFNAVGGHDYLSAIASLCKIISGPNYSSQQGLVEIIQEHGKLKIIANHLANEVKHLDKIKIPKSFPSSINLEKLNERDKDILQNHFAAALRKVVKKNKYKLKYLSELNKSRFRSQGSANSKISVMAHTLGINEYNLFQFYLSSQCVAQQYLKLLNLIKH